LTIGAKLWTAGFNPRARVGRDSEGKEVLDPSDGFNPRARVGRDDPRMLGYEGPFGVSIHAPAWGATVLTIGAKLWTAGFNPRARVGRDLICITTYICLMEVSIHAPAWGATN